MARANIEDTTGAARSPGALANPNFRLLWGNNIAYFLVANAERFVFGWLVLDGLQRSEKDQGLVVFTLGVPAALFTLHAGVWADRVDRRRLLMGTQIAGAVIMAGTALLVASGRATMGWVIVATLIAGTAAALGAPVRASLVPALVAKEQLFSAIAINALAMTASLILGPVLARAVGQRFDFEGAFWFQSGLMMVGVLFLIRLEVPDLDERPARRSVVAEASEAVKHVWHDQSLRTLFGLLIVASFTINPAVMVTVQAHVKEALGRDAGDAALPLAMMGVGIAISSIVVIKRGDMANKGTLFQRAVIIGSTMTFLMGRTTSLPPLLGLAFVMGLAGGFYINMNQGLIQANTPQHLMGRVMSLFALTQAGFMPMGALVLGTIADSAGTGGTISAVAAVAWCIFVWVYVRNAELRSLS